MLAHWPLLSWLPSHYKTQMKFLGTTAFWWPRLKGRRCWGFPSPDFSVGTPASPPLQATVRAMWNTWIKDFISVFGHDLPCVPSSQTLVFPNKNLSLYMVFPHQWYSPLFPVTSRGSTSHREFIQEFTSLCHDTTCFPPSLVSTVGRRKKKNPKHSIKKLKGRLEIGVSLLVPTSPSLLVPSASREHMDCTLQGTGKSATLFYMDKGQIRARTAKAQ